MTLSPAAVPTSSRAVTGLAWALVLALGSLVSVDVIRGQWDHDGGFYLLRAAYVAAGFRPYVDYTSIYPPLFELIHAPFVMVIRDRVFLAVALPVLWNLANAAASARLAAALGASARVQLLSAAGFVALSLENGGNHLTLEHGVTFFSLVALSQALRRGSLTPAGAALCGFALICSALSKQNGVVVGLPVAAALFARRHEITRRHVTSFGAGLLAPGLAILAWLGFDVASIWQNLVVLLGKYAAASRGGLVDHHQEMLRSAPTLFFLVVVASVGIAALLPGSRRMTSAALLAGAALELLPRLVRNFPHYTLNVWPFALAILVLAIHSPFPSLSRLARGASGAVLAGALVVLTLPQSTERWSSPGPLLRAFAPSARAIEAGSSPKDRVVQYGAEPILEFLAHRLPRELSLSEEVLHGWDGTHMVGVAPRPGEIPVVVDIGQPWTEGIRRRLEAAGHLPASDIRFHRKLRITVYHCVHEPGE